MADELINCEGHGQQPATLVCVHLAESDPEGDKLGFHWNDDEGGLTGNCDECEALCDAEGFFPDDLVEETFVVICKGCFTEIAQAHGVEIAVAPSPAN